MPRSESGEPVLDHVLITRFNTRITEDPTAGRHLDPVWLDARVRLFEQLCLPSVAAARHDRLRWLVLSDDRTPGAARARLERIATGAFELVTTSGTVDGETLGALVRDRVTTDAVLTTRLDSDDAVGPAMLRAVHRRAQDERVEVLSCPFGHQVAAGRCYRRIYLQNPFISLREPTQACRTVLSFQHHDLRGRRVTYLPIRDAWFQFLHDTNLANELRGVRVRGRRPTRTLGAAGVEIPDVGDDDHWVRELCTTSVRQLGRAAAAGPRIVGLLRRTSR